MKVKQIMDVHNQHATRRRKHQMLLRGFIFCGNCDNQMWAEKHVKKSGLIFNHYFCHVCGEGSYVTTDALEERVTKLFQKIQISKDYVQHVLNSAEKVLQQDRDNQHSEKVRIYHEKTKIEKAMREIEDARFIHHTLSEEGFNSIYARYEQQLKNTEDQLSDLGKDHSQSIEVLGKVLALAENIGKAYTDAPYLLKRNYLNIFFKRLIIKNGRIARFELTDELNPLIKNGFVLVKQIELPLVNMFRNKEIQIEIRLESIKFFYEDNNLEFPYYLK